MRVTFNTNLGSRDAERCGIDFKLATGGSELDCDEQSGKWLVSQGIATEVVVPKPVEPEFIHAVPVTELVADPVVDVVTETEPEAEPTKPQHNNKHRRNN